MQLSSCIQCVFFVHAGFQFRSTCASWKTNASVVLNVPGVLWSHIKINVMLSLICASYLMKIATSNKTAFVFQMNEIKKNISISHSVWTFTLKWRPLYCTHFDFTGVFLGLNVLCPLLITCWWPAFDALRFIINSLDGESEDLHRENKSVDISPSFSAVGCVLPWGLHCLWQQPSIHRFVCIGQKLQIEKESSEKWESTVRYTGFLPLLTLSVCCTPYFLPNLLHLSVG